MNGQNTSGILVLRDTDDRTPGVSSILAELKLSGFEGASVDKDGRVVAVHVKFPRMEPQELSPATIEAIAEILGTPEPDADSPESIFQRTKSVDADGTLTAKLSYKSRSRSITVPEAERALVADLLLSFVERAQRMADKARAAQKPSVQTGEGSAAK